MLRSLGKYIKNSFARFDKPVLLFSMLITLMSIITIFSARENFGNSKFIMQFAMTVVGICAIMVIVNIDYRIFVERYWKILWIISVALLGITLVLGDTGANGTETSNKSWLTIVKFGSKSFQIQPSEFVKIAFIISFSKHLSMVKDSINKIKTLIPLGIHAGAIVGLILLSGDLGAGKTEFVKGIAEFFGIKEQVTSPTYAYLNIYGDFIYHYDCYRLSSGEDAELLGLTDYFNKNNICLIEWAENISSALPKNYKTVNITKIDENTRKIVL
jgi:tRNA threonylcarbamoyladenosine biosynthesis protein TsaE